MRAQRAGTNKLISARLKVYDEAVQAGLSSPSAMKLAQLVVRKSLRGKARTVVITTDVLEQLQPHADKRGISVNELIRRLLDHIADDGLVNSILED